MDLFFWLGPHLSLAPLIERTVGSIAAPAGLTAEMLQNYQNYKDWLLRAGNSFNLFSLLTINLPGIPSLMSGREGIGPVVTLSDPSITLLLILLLPVVGLWLASVYYVSVGGPVRGINESAGAMLGRVWRTWGRLLLFLLLVLGVGLLLAVPVTLLAALAGSANSSLEGSVFAFFWVAGMWVLFYLFFVVDAMVISDAGPIQAVRNSVAVVKSNLGSTLGLVILIWIITLGMPVVWDALAQNVVGTAIGILGNAYISTGLAVASMTFYRDRFLALNNRMIVVRDPAKN